MNYNYSVSSVNSHVTYKKHSDYKDVILLNIILFIYPFEFFESVHVDKILGEFSPFRIIILPICLYYLLKELIGHKKVNTSIKDIVIGLFFIATLLASVMSSNIASIFSVFGNIVQFYMIYLMYKRIGTKQSTLMVITTWGLIQIPVLLLSIASGNIGMTLRFHGLFFDPNYLCAMISASVCAACFLFRITNKSFLKAYCVVIACVGILMIFLSFSRGGLLTILLLASLYLLVYHKKIFVILIAVLIPVVSAMMVRAAFVSWADGANNVFDAFIFRTFTMSEDASVMTSGRSDYIDVFIKNIDDFLIFGTDLDNYIATYNQGAYPHNGIIELFIQGGVLFGGLYVICLLLSIMKEIRMSLIYKSISPSLMFSLGILVPLTFLSYASKLTWLSMAIIFALSSRENYIRHLLYNIKGK